ncbi:mitochondrial-processing peptidase subunit alpha-like [Actinia tenebrosa]|uniref:Mitochondrial-processing peptidase subunit alpha n=1 Tax=Actinia tenebrosa TaxID=6105 RepID=A0A6P8HJV6_ACTTE|nr:mitochondrial-processing peptidase subunit alpha-like [Actinia tenebrosa]
MSYLYRKIASNPLCSVSRVLRGYPIVFVPSRLCANSNVPPLDQPIVKLPPPPPGVVEHVKWTRDHHETQVTTLENGIRVASEESFGQFSTVGVVIDAGSRYEVDCPAGITHVLEKLAFQSTARFPNQDDILQILEPVGGMADCTSFRDAIVYGTSTFTSGVPMAMEVLSEGILYPNISEQEVEEQKMTVQFELENLEFKLDPEPLLTDMIHAAAYRDNTLGLPKLCPPDSLGKINVKEIIQFLQRYYLPSRMVVTGVNVDHEQLIDLTRQYFVNKKPTWMADEDVVIKPPDKSIAQYTGGIIKEHLNEPRINPGPSPLPELAHISIGLESCPYVDEDFFAFTVLNTLMGGGGSFSAGGPGKGMYSRLYLNVLNRYHWIYSATAFHHSYADSGMFCIHASTHPSRVHDLAQVIIREYFSLASGLISESEVARAKKQLQSMLMMNLESRIIVFEDIGRQVLGLGERRTAKDLYDCIEAVTIDDIKRVSSRMLSTNPSVAAFGNLSMLPKFESFQQAFANKGVFPGKSLFFNFRRV